MTVMEESLWDTFENIENNTGRKRKLELLEDYCDQGPEFKETLADVVMYACNPVWTYGVIDSKVYPTLSGKKEGGWFNFTEALDLLKRRKVTGNAAASLVKKVLSSAIKPKWYQRVLNRDLNIGVGVDTFLKIFPGLFPVMNPMLCKKFEGGDLPYPYIVQPKLDGLRCVIIVDERKNMVALSRNNKQLHNVDHIFRELKKSNKKSYVLDGELYGTNWNKTISVLSTEVPHKEAKKIKFFVFDVIALNAWKNQESVTKLKHKAEPLNFIAKGMKFIKALPMNIKAQTVEEIRHQFEMHLAKGYEGIVLKDPESTYTFNRSSSWLKVKATNDCDLKIVDIVRGDAGSRNENRMGAIVGEGKILLGPPIDKNPIEVKIRTSVGTGFSDKQREEFWSNPKKFLGKTAEIEYQEIAMTTKKQKTYALRFPVFKRIRTDK